MEQKLWNNNLKQLRVERGYSQQQVAELLGLKSHNRICRWEKGQLVPHLKNLIKLSELYQLPISEFSFGLRDIY